jgi:Fe-S-cluster containining protein
LATQKIIVDTKLCRVDDYEPQRHKDTKNTQSKKRCKNIIVETQKILVETQRIASLQGIHKDLTKMKEIPLAQIPRRSNYQLTDEIRGCIAAYRDSLERREELYAGIRSDFPHQIACGPRCNECCYQLFHIRMLDIFMVRESFRHLSPTQRHQISERAEVWHSHLSDIQAYMLIGQRTEIPLLAAKELSLPYSGMACPFLIEGKGCQIYSHRPSICRSYGYPQLTADGEMKSTCYKNLQGLSSSDLAAYTLPYRRSLEVEQLKEQLAAMLGVAQWTGFAVIIGLTLPILFDPMSIDWPTLMGQNE